MLFSCLNITNTNLKEKTHSYFLYSHTFLSHTHSQGSVSSSRYTFMYHPGDSIRPMDTIVFDRICVGFHRNPTSFIKYRSDSTRFVSDSHRSESGPDFIGIRRNSYKIRDGSGRMSTRSVQIPMKSGPDSDRWESDKNLVGFDWIIQIRQDPISHESPGQSM